MPSKNVSPAACLFKTRCHINPVGSLHGKLTVTANVAPGCPATPWQARPAHPSFTPFLHQPRTRRGQPVIGHWMLDVSSINPPIKAETPAIKANRASSRQTPIFQTAIHTANPPAGWGEPAVESSKRVPRFSLSAGERAGVRASVTTNQSPFAPTRSQSRQKPL